MGYYKPHVLIWASTRYCCEPHVPPWPSSVNSPFSLLQIKFQATPQQFSFFDPPTNLKIHTKITTSFTTSIRAALQGLRSSQDPEVQSLLKTVIGTKGAEHLYDKPNIAILTEATSLLAHQTSITTFGEFPMESVALTTEDPTLLQIFRERQEAAEGDAESLIQSKPYDGNPENIISTTKFGSFRASSVATARIIAKSMMSEALKNGPCGIAPTILATKVVPVMTTDKKQSGLYRCFITTFDDSSTHRVLSLIHIHKKQHALFDIYFTTPPPTPAQPPKLITSRHPLPLQPDKVSQSSERIP